MTKRHRGWSAHLTGDRIGVLVMAILFLLGLSDAAVGQDSRVASPAGTASTSGFVVESYYRVKWGSEEEFLSLFQRNHVPFLRRQLEKGVLLDVRFDAPREHMPEDSRWDLRMTLVYRDAATAYALDNITEEDYTAIVKDDQSEQIFQREEKRRFELLLAHWDVNVKRVEGLSMIK